MSNVWLGMNRGALSACARRPVFQCHPVRAFATQQWHQQNPAVTRDRTIAARTFQLLTRRLFSKSAGCLARVVSQGGNKQRPVTHARPWRSSEAKPPSAPLNEHKLEEIEEAEDVAQAETAASMPPQIPTVTPAPLTIHYTLPDQPYDQEQIGKIFGEGRDIGTRQGNYILAVLHQRRLTGSIVEEGISEPAQKGNWNRPAAAEALQWLRLKHPVDEEATTAQWAEDEAKKLEHELYVQRAEGWGLIKRVDGAQAKPDKPSVSPYAGGVLSEITSNIKKQRVINEKRRDEADAKEERERLKVQEQLLRERRRAQSRESSAKKTVKNLQGRDGQVQEYISHEGLKEWGGYKNESQWARRYRQDAAKHALRRPPEMNKFERLGPATLVTVLTLVACTVLALTYTSSDIRLLPFISPAAATCGGIIALNMAVLFLWRYPPFWRAMNKYFVLSPGYPYAISLIGNAFSHQQFYHLCVNMLAVGTVGTILHEWLGRGDFLALYIASGVFGSWLSLSARVLTGALYSWTLGASSCICGIIAGAALFAPNHTWTWRMPFTDTEVGVWSVGILAVFVIVDALGIVVKSGTLDHWAHLGGWIAGGVGSVLLQRSHGQRMTTMEQKRREGWIGGGAMWRQDGGRRRDREVHEVGAFGRVLFTISNPKKVE